MMIMGPISNRWKGADVYIRTRYPSYLLNTCSVMMYAVLQEFIIREPGKFEFLGYVCGISGHYRPFKADFDPQVGPSLWYFTQ